MASIAARLRVGSSFDLASVDARRIVAGPKDKDTARAEVAALESEVTSLQERLWAEAKQGARRRVVVVLQGMDTSGKGGAGKLIDRLLPPFGNAFASFGKPTDEERAHHFLWRIERKLPPPGVVGVFDRSHYEDVLVVRVEQLVPEDVWRGRYDEINDWEARWHAEGVTWLKVMLHVSRDEQRDRLLARLDDPTKRWKYNPGDVDVRAKWDAYQAAYQEALVRCSTDIAPWHVIPADRKWHRDWLLAHLLHETLVAMAPRYPEIDYDVETEKRRIAAS